MWAGELRHARGPGGVEGEEPFAAGRPGVHFDGPEARDGAQQVVR